MWEVVKPAWWCEGRLFEGGSGVVWSPWIGVVEGGGSVVALAFGEGGWEGDVTVCPPLVVFSEAILVRSVFL